ncbi:MAG: DUF853 family protein [Anaerolineae bacterium]|nr:DUF853 family protein [Gemmatimonadaceae bacterium]
MDAKVVDAARATFPASTSGVTLGAVVHDGVSHPEPLVSISLAMLNRHGLIAGATGTGKTKTLQLIAEQLSRAGIPVFLADIKGDVSGIAAPGETNDRVTTRARDTGYVWAPAASPVEFLSLTGAKGAQLRATVSSFGPLLLSKVLDLNSTQTSVLSLVFKYCDDRGLLLLDFADLRSVLQYLTESGSSELREYGGMSKVTVGVLLRKMVELEQQGAKTFFGEPEFDLNDLMQTARDGRGMISVLELQDVQEKPALFSTFMLWMLATLYNDLPEVGDIAKPKLVFFFDEAHLLFDDASEALVEQIEQVVRLIRSKGIGIFFVTQSPKDVPASVLGQLGHRVQHALRAFTPDDDKALKAAARTFPKSSFYDIEETMTTLGIGEALITVLSPNGVPTTPFATRLIPPTSRMGPLTDAELAQRLASSAQVHEYAQAVDRESAREALAERADATARTMSDEAEKAAGAETGRARPVREPPTTFEKILKSPVSRTVAGAVTRGLMGALFGAPRRRRRSPGGWLAAIMLTLGSVSGAFLSLTAQTPKPLVIAVSDTLYEVRLADGSTIIGRVIASDSVRVTLMTSNAVRLEIPRDQVRSLRPARGRVSKGQMWTEDPNTSRLMFGPTARTVRRGEGYLGVYELFFPYVAFGVTDFFTLAGGTPVFPGVIGQAFYVAPKARVFATERAQLGVGALVFFATQEIDEDPLGIGYVVGTFGSNDNALTLGAGFGFYGDEVTSKPAFLVGGERRISPRVKLITENYLVLYEGTTFHPSSGTIEPRTESLGLLSLGVRLFGERLSADFGLGGIVGEDGGGGCCLPLVNFVFAFGSR